MKIHPVQKIHSSIIKGDFFSLYQNLPTLSIKQLYSYDKIANGFYPFSSHYIAFNQSINWHYNYLESKESTRRADNWWEIPDFSIEIGDIKTLWELSRFDWVVQFAILSLSGEKRALKTLNDRLVDWSISNPPFKGVNWKCGQEASIRVMHLIYASIILKQYKAPTLFFLDFIELHLERIYPTISYAIGQNNNHGTSEAAALFVGGHFLNYHGRFKGKKYEETGRYWLENRAKKLFSNDGVFSQYSVTYHRVALDTYCFCETYRRLFNIQPFSKILINKLQLATEWLALLTNPITGDAPNLGSNDGARLFPSLNSQYRDFRPTVQWANIVFNGFKAYDNLSDQDLILEQLGLNIKLLPFRPYKGEKLLIGTGGFFVNKNDMFLAILRRPIFNHRPVQSDVLHFDLWYKGNNLLKDSGTYSYNSINRKNDYTSSKAHNTISFDDHDQMPKLSRFLFGDWLKETVFEFTDSNTNKIIISGYNDKWGASHIRKVDFEKDAISITDEISGFNRSATLNWRTPKDIIVKEDGSIGNDQFELKIEDSKNCGTIKIVQDVESLNYFSENDVMAIQYTVVKPCTIVTKIILK